MLFAAGEEPFGTDGDQSQTHSQPLPESSAIERTSLLENEFEPVLSEEELSKEQEKGCFDDDDNNNGKRKPRKTLYDYEGRVMGISGLPAIPGLSHISIGYEHIGCPKFISVCLALILAIAVLSGLIIFFIDAVQQFEQNNWKKYEDRAIELAADFLAFLKRNFNIDGSKIFEQILKDVKVFEITTVGGLVHSSCLFFPPVLCSYCCFVELGSTVDGCFGLYLHCLSVRAVHAV